MTDGGGPATARRFAAIARIVRLGVPMTASRLGMLLILVTDVAMLGRIDTAALAAYAVASMPTQLLIAVSTGLLASVTLLVARSAPADTTAAPRVLVAGTAVALVAGCIAAAVLLAVPAFLPAVVGDPVLAVNGAPAIRAFALGMPGLCLFLALAAFHEARANVVPVVWAVGAGIAVNAAGNALLLHEGEAAAGLASNAALTTTVARWSMCVILLPLSWPDRPREGFRLSAGTLRVLRTGAPMAFASLLESSAFTTIALFATRFGESAVAAYEVSSTIVRIAHLPALGLGAAATVLVGRALGQGDAPAARAAVQAGGAVVLAMMAAFAIPLVAAPQAVGRWFTAEPAILTLLVVLFPITAAIVVADGAQAVLAGSLRGLGDVAVPAGLHILSFWLVAVPFGYGLGIRLNLSIHGCAGGLALGLVAACLAFLVRLRSLAPLRSARVRV